MTVQVSVVLLDVQLPGISVPPFTRNTIDPAGIWVPSRVALAVKAAMALPYVAVAGCRFMEYAALPELTMRTLSISTALLPEVDVPTRANVLVALDAVKLAA